MEGEGGKIALSTQARHSDGSRGRRGAGGKSDMSLGLARSRKPPCLACSGNVLPPHPSQGLPGSRRDNVPYYSKNLIKSEVTT